MAPLKFIMSNVLAPSFCTLHRLTPLHYTNYLSNQLRCFTTKPKNFIGRGFLIPCKVKGPLFNLLQEEELTRSQAVKLVWKYIKDQGLQHPENRRIVVSDAKLFDLFGKEQVTFGEVGKAIHRNLETIRKPKE